MMKIQELLETKLGKTIKEASNAEVYYALLHVVQNMAKDKEVPVKKKKIYYISAEFLIGKLLSNNMINLGIYDDVKKMLAENGKDICEIEEIEPEPSLGNGGLGRLAACFLDSIATLGLPGDGIGLNYHFGLFQQKFTNHKQQELKNPWITKESWLNRQSFTCKVPFKDFTMDGVLYDIDVPGYDSGCNRLHLFDVDTIDESIVPENSINFNKKKVQENLTLFLYPDDSDDAGRKLRIYQQYFMVSCGAQLILKEMEDAGYDLHELNNHAVIQINDTHPSMVIPELIRLLTEEKGFTMDEAVETANNIAPEHLELVTANPFEVMTKIRNAGAIFIGEYSSEPLGDYFAGPNHILPTNGTAKFFSPLGVDDFIKKSSIIYYSREALEKAHKDIEDFAEAEHLTAHANSVRVRFE